MQYELGQQLIRTNTNQRFSIKKVVGVCKKNHALKLELMYGLKGPHPSLDLIVRKSELDELFTVAN